MNRLVSIGAFLWNTLIFRKRIRNMRCWRTLKVLSNTKRGFPKNIEVIFFESLRLPLAKGSSTSNQAFLLRRKDVTALRCSEPLRYKVGEPKRSTPYYAGWDRLAVMGISLQLYCWKWVHGGGRLSPPKLFLIAVSLCTCRHSNEEYYFYSTFDRITSGEVPIRVMAEILWPPLAFNEWPQW